MDNEPITCACCGNHEGDIIDDHIIRVSPIQIISRFSVPRHTQLTINLCKICKTAMSFNIEKLVIHIDSFDDRVSANDALLGGFIRQYIQEIWPDANPPTVQDLCRVLNGVGILTPRGAKWEYHNLAQHMLRLDISRQDLINNRPTSTYIERLRALLDSSKEFTANMMNINHDYLKKAQEIMTTTDIQGSWSPAEALPLPDDMPMAQPIISQEV